MKNILQAGNLLRAELKNFPLPKNALGPPAVSLWVKRPYGKLT